MKWAYLVAISQVMNAQVIKCCIWGYLSRIERGDSAIRSCVSVQGSLTMYPIHAFGTEEQKNKYLPRNG